MSNVKVNFFLKSRTNYLNQSPIVNTLTLGYDRTQVFTGIWIPMDRWNEKTKQVFVKKPSAMSILHLYRNQKLWAFQNMSSAEGTP